MATNFRSDLVQDSLLATAFLPGGVVQHTIVAPSRTVRARVHYQKEEWTVARELGRGGFGRVHLQKGASTRVRAVKTIPKIHASVSIDYSRELEAAFKFSHRRYVHCFVEAFGWYEDVANVYLAMEYLPHGSLQSYMSSVLFSETEAKHIAQQLSEGLVFMHDNGFVHRDLKPENILVVNPSPDWWVKIGDFGISKRAYGSIEGVHTIIGTEGYCAPEVFMGSAMSEQPDQSNEEGALTTYGSSVDMWALGEVIFRVLARQPAFQNRQDMFWFITRGKLLNLQPIKSVEASDSCQNWIANLLRVDPSTRLTASAAIEHVWLSGLTDCKDTRNDAESEVAPAEGSFKSCESVEEQDTLGSDGVEGQNIDETGLENALTLVEPPPPDNEFFGETETEPQKVSLQHKWAAHANTESEGPVTAIKQEGHLPKLSPTIVDEKGGLLSGPEQHLSASPTDGLTTIKPEEAGVLNAIDIVKSRPEEHSMNNANEQVFANEERHDGIPATTTSILDPRITAPESDSTMDPLKADSLNLDVPERSVAHSVLQNQKPAQEWRGDKELDPESLPSPRPNWILYYGERPWETPTEKEERRQKYIQWVQQLAADPSSNDQNALDRGQHEVDSSNHGKPAASPHLESDDNPEKTQETSTLPYTSDLKRQLVEVKFQHGYDIFTVFLRQHDGMAELVASIRAELGLSSSKYHIGIRKRPWVQKHLTNLTEESLRGAMQSGRPVELQVETWAALYTCGADDGYCDSWGRFELNEESPEDGTVVTRLRFNLWEFSSTSALMSYIRMVAREEAPVRIMYAHIRGHSTQATILNDNDLEDVLDNGLWNVSIHLLTDRIRKPLEWIVPVPLGSKFYKCESYATSEDEHLVGWTVMIRKIWPGTFEDFCRLARMVVEPGAHERLFYVDLTPSECALDDPVPWDSDYRAYRRLETADQYITAQRLQNQQDSSSMDYKFFVAHQPLGQQPRDSTDLSQFGDMAERIVIFEGEERSIFFCHLCLKCVKRSIELDLEVEIGKEVFVWLRRRGKHSARLVTEDVDLEPARESPRDYRLEIGKSVIARLRWL